MSTLTQQLDEFLAGWRQRVPPERQAAMERHIAHLAETGFGRQAAQVGDQAPDIVLPDANGKPIPGFTLEDSAVLVGDRIAGRARWKSGADVGALANRAGARRYRAAAEGSDPPVAGSLLVGQRDWHTWKQAFEVLLYVASRIRSVEDRFLRCGAVPPPPLPAVFEAKRRRHVYIGVRTRECAGGAHHEQPAASGEGHRAISVREPRHSARQRYTRFTCLDWQASARVSDGPIVPVAAGLVRAKLRSVRMHEPFAACHHRSLSCRTRRSPKPPERVS